MRLKVMHTNSEMLQITPGVQGLPCLLTLIQGKLCTPASVLIAPLDDKLSVVDVKAKDRAEGCAEERSASTVQGLKTRMMPFVPRHILRYCLLFK